MVYPTGRFIASLKNRWCWHPGTAWSGGLTHGPSASAALDTAKCRTANSSPSVPTSAASLGRSWPISGSSTCSKAAFFSSSGATQFPVALEQAILQAAIGGCRVCASWAGSALSTRGFGTIGKEIRGDLPPKIRWKISTRSACLHFLRFAQAGGERDDTAEQFGVLERELERAEPAHAHPLDRPRPARPLRCGRWRRYAGSTRR